ncbi:MAG: citrate synthase [Chloroflexi bacterium]|nr:citrate synthase [Chloroflexota bacterium]MCY3937460.1 citrate synthase [Chloroflexota bacterium]
MSARISLNGTDLDLAIVEGSEGELAVDVTKLRAQTGFVTIDPGYSNTAAARSAITFIDGEQGILKHRGIPIQELAEQSSFLETAYLLINGDLPTKSELDSFVGRITRHTMLHEQLYRFYEGFPQQAHPMAVCSAVVSALSAFYPEFLDPRTPNQVDAAIIRLLAKLPTIASLSYKHAIGQPPIYPNNSLDYASNFLRMMFATPAEEYVVNDVVARALDLIFILHADHEQNCSTSTVRLVGSSLANAFASISAGINALWGPLHGGANQKVIEMLESIEAGEGSAQDFVNRAKDRSTGTRLMGFGHAVYKSHDPRAGILKNTCHEVIAELGVTSRLLDIAMDLEEIALSDEYFISRRLYPNVDFYSGVIMNAIGIPENMFTVIFAIGRLPGWIAHWKEMHQDADFKIGRPRQIYVGPTDRSFVPIEER